MNIAIKHTNSRRIFLDKLNGGHGCYLIHVNKVYVYRRTVEIKPNNRSLMARANLGNITARCQGTRPLKSSRDSLAGKMDLQQWLTISHKGKHSGDIHILRYDIIVIARFYVKPNRHNRVINPVFFVT